MAAIMCQVLPQFYRDFNDKTIFISVSVKEYKPYLLTKKYSVATHNDNFCPLKTCRYHIILISSSVKEILEKMENLSYVYQTVDCLYTLYTSVLWFHYRRVRSGLYSVNQSGRAQLGEKVRGKSAQYLQKTIEQKEVQASPSTR